MPVAAVFDIHKMNRDPVTDPYLLLVEAEEMHTGIVHRFVVDNTPLTSRGEVFEPLAIEFTLPAKGEEQQPVTATVSNVDREAGRVVLSASSRVMVRLIVIDATAPDVYLIDTLDMFFAAEAPITFEDVDLTLAPVIDWQSPVPFYKTTQNLFPGVWV